MPVVLSIGNSHQDGSTVWTGRITELERELHSLLSGEAEELLELVGGGSLTAAHLVGEVAGIGRFDGDVKLDQAGRLGAAAQRAFTRARMPTSSASRPKARAAVRRFAASSATSPVPSTHPPNDRREEDVTDDGAGHGTRVHRSNWCAFRIEKRAGPHALTFPQTRTYPLDGRRRSRGAAFRIVAAAYVRHSWEGAL